MSSCFDSRDPRDSPWTNLLLTEDVVENLVKALILYYLLPTVDDLHEWESDPEFHFNEELRLCRT